MIIKATTLFIWLFTSAWNETSVDNFNLNAPSAGTYKLEATLESATPAFTTSLSWEQNLSGSNNNYSEIFFAFDGTVADTIYLRVGETGAEDPLRIRTHLGGTLNPIYASEFNLASFGSAFHLNIIAKKDSLDSNVYLFIKEPNQGYILPICAVNLSDINLNLSSIGITAKCTSSNTQNFSFSVQQFSTNYSPSIPLKVIAHELNPDASLDLTLNQRLESELFASFTTTTSDIPISNLNTVASLNKARLQLPISSLRNGIPRTLRLFNSEIDTTLYVVLIGTNTASFREVVITEIMADATPSMSNIPEDEYLELYNASNSVIDVNGWSIIDSGDPYTLIHDWDGLLYPDSTFLIVRSKNLWSSYPGNKSELSNWSGLNDNGERLELVQQNGSTIDILEYSKSWWLENNIVTQAGRSASKNHPRACNIASNWHPSPAPSGSSPWIFAPTTPPPNSAIPLITPHKLSTSEISIEFSPPIAPASPAKIRSSPLSPWTPLHYSNETWTAPLSLPTEKTSLLELDSMISCANSTKHPIVLKHWEIIEPADKNSLVISEICHTPLDGEAEWVELANVSDNKIDITYVKLNETCIINEINEPTLQPRSTLLISENNSSNWSQLSSEGDEILLTLNSDTIDLVRYSKCWHTSHKAFNDGASLEKIDLIELSNNPNNWESGTGHWNSSPGKFREDRAPKRPHTGAVIWAMENEQLVWQSPVSMDSSVLNPAFWTPSINWQFLDLGQTKAVTTDNLNLHSDSIYCSNWLPLNSKSASTLTFHNHHFDPQSNSLLINEVLSEPVDSSARFLEFANKSESHILISDYLITTDEFTQANSWTQLTSHKYLIPPKSQIALAECASWVQNLSVNSNCINAELPSLQEGRKIIISKDYESAIDSYLIPDSEEGISSERLCYNQDIWSKAPASQGGSSPGLPNHNTCSEDPEVVNYLEVWPKTLKRNSDNNRWVNIAVKEISKGELRVFSMWGEQIYEQDVEGEMRTIWEGDDRNGWRVMPGNYVMELRGIMGSGKAIIKRELVVILE